MVTRWFIYQPEKVRITWLAGVKLDPPPYSSWSLIGFQDSEDYHVLTRPEVSVRLASRKKL
jgi:hypothetical protein